jgi:Fanconi-associated nuclease 1
MIILFRYHSEGRIMRHIFLLLFWSIIFQPVEGAFETSYQIAPLDIGHDSFYFARRAEIEARLKEIEDGGGVRIARETDERERKLNTFAIGAAWDLCTREDAIEIIQVRTHTISRRLHHLTGLICGSV